MMGMYDTVYCYYPLPDNYVSEVGFQTKDVYQRLVELHITAEGRLLYGGSELDEFPTHRNEGMSEIVYHGDIIFYDNQRQFVARFWHGRVRFIIPVPSSATEHYFERGFLNWLGNRGMGDAAAAFPWRDRDLDEMGISHFAEYGITEKIAAAYLNSLNQHIAYVRQAGQIIGVPQDQLHHHDQSKFSLEEFPYYARNFFGDKGDPDGWEKAWLHHENHNPHHWGHWIARSGKMAGKPLPMPMNYVQEMVADWHGAGKAYQGSWNISSWVSQQGPGFTLHPETERLVDEVMHSIGYVITDNCMWSYMAGHKFYELFGEPAPGEVK
jgi:hypothetical protein